MENKSSVYKFNSPRDFSVAKINIIITKSSITIFSILSPSIADTELLPSTPRLSARSLPNVPLSGSTLKGSFSIALIS